VNRNKRPLKHFVSYRPVTVLRTCLALLQDPKRMIRVQIVAKCLALPQPSTDASSHLHMCHTRVTLGEPLDAVELLLRMGVGTERTNHECLPVSGREEPSSSDGERSARLGQGGLQSVPTHLLDQLADH